MEKINNSMDVQDRVKYEFYSQHFQDVFIFRNLINQKCNGIFTEIGGNDGSIGSNTKFFEDVLDFTGMLVEPHPVAFDMMKENRRNYILLTSYYED